MRTWYKVLETTQQLTAFRDAQFTVISSPLTSTTSPSIQASSGSSTQTKDPTIELTWAACLANKFNSTSIRE